MTGAIGGIALRPDGFLLTTGSFDTLVSVLDVRTWRLLHSLEVCGQIAPATEILSWHI